jgi:hypothetical protein
MTAEPAPSVGSLEVSVYVAWYVALVPAASSVRNCLACADSAPLAGLDAADAGQDPPSPTMTSASAAGTMTANPDHFVTTAN